MAAKQEEEEMNRAPPKEDDDEDPKAKKKKPEKSWFRNPFRKDDDGKAEKEREAKKQHKLKEEENKKAKEVAESKKVEQEETQREKEKKQRQQELLQKNLDPSRRVFQMHMKAIKLENLGEKPLLSTFLRVTLGGDYSEREEPGKGIVRKGTKGQVFHTHRASKLKPGDSMFYRNEFGSGVPVYWMGSYVDLEMQEFLLEVCRRRITRRVNKLGEARVNLGSIAQGSIMQMLEIEDENTGLHVKTNFVIYFQELFVYQLRFVDWRGFKLKAADAPKRRKRTEQAEAAEEKKKRIREERQERRAARLQAERDRRAKIRQQRMEKQARAVAKKNGTPLPNTGATDGGAGETGGADEATGGGGDDQARLIGGPTSDETGQGAASIKRQSILRRLAARKRKHHTATTTTTHKKMTSKQLANVAAAKEEEKRLAREAREKKTLEKIKAKQDKKVAKRKEKAIREAEKAELDKDRYEEPSSDPYIVFSIDPPANPGCKIFRHGGYFGRTVRTDMVPNSLNPTWEEARKPLAYLGTRSELENEILHIRVYDWDFLSSDDLIGEADVPLNGLLEYGQVEVELTLDEPDPEGKEIRGKKPMKSVPAGRLTGQILFDGKIPEYNQIGDLIERKPGITYLAVRINHATKLIPADPNGSSDPFVIVEWDGCQQSTRVIPRTLEPIWNQTLYFPLKMVTITQAGLEGKPPISVRCFDMDEAGHDLLGSCEIPLHRITSAEHARIEDEFDSTGKPHKGRVLKLPAQKLDLPGHTIQSTIDLWAYFINDLPLDIHLEQPTSSASTTLSKEYEQRAKTFIGGLAPAVRQAIESAMKLQLGKPEESDLDQDQLKAMICATDQDGCEHFFCEYLTPVIPPSEMDSAIKVARMVRCITWSDDEETFKNEKSKEVWQAPPFFMEMRKGDMEDHALLMCNLLLGLGLDAYVCVGRLEGSKELEKRHVWVMTREEDGSVKMYETSNGEPITLPDRWETLDLAEAKKEEAEALGKSLRSALASGVSKTRGIAAYTAMQTLRQTGKLASQVVTSAGDAGRVIVGADEDSTRKPEAVEAAAVVPVATEAAEAESAKRRRRRVQQTIDDDLLAGGEMMRDEDNEDELLNRIDIEERMAEVQFGDVIVSEEQEAILRDRAKRFSKRGAGAKEELNDDSLPNLPDVSLPYAQLEAVFNHKNLWIPRLHTDPAKITYNFDEGAFATNREEASRARGEWDAFIDPRMRSMGLPQAFYQPKRLAPKPPADRLRAMEHQIQSELKLQITYSRVGIPTIINKSAELEDTLKHGLELQERVRIGDKTARKELDSWSREVKSKLPPGSTFRARVINYSYTDAKKIRKHLLSSTDYASRQDDGTQFALAVKCFGFYGGICSVWVHFGLIDTDLLS